MIVVTVADINGIIWARIRCAVRSPSWRQHILPAFRVWAPQHILPTLRIWAAEFILISRSVGPTEHILPALRIWAAELILMPRSVGAAQQIACVLSWLRSVLVTCHLDLLVLDTR
jgi:hypothetical protein